MATTAVIGDHLDADVRTGSAFSRILDYDLARPLAFVALALIYVASRVPWINIGYGTDPDAWRVALTGHWLWDEREFYPSRLPGYPVHELASAAVIKGGWLATNSLTVLVSVLGLWFFARIVSELQLPNRGLIVAGFAFTPLVWINSMTTMDYMWALTFVLGCYYLLMEEETAPAGLMLGLAAASRSTSLLFVLPFAVYLWRDGRGNELRDFVTWTVFVPVILYLPVAWKYGLNFLAFYDSDVGYLSVLRLLGKDCLGLLGAVAVMAAAALSLPRLARLPGDVWRDKHVMLWVLMLAVTLAVFLRLPHEAAYLLPMYPFAFLLMAKYFHRLALAGAVTVIVAAGFVDLTSPGDEIDSEAFTNARLGSGLILSNADTMRAQRDFVRSLEAYDIPDGAVVQLGFIYPQYVGRNRDRLDVSILEKDKDAISQLSDKGQATDRQTRIVYVWLLEFKQYERLKNTGYGFFYTVDAGRSTAALYNYRLGLYDQTLIDLGRGPSGGSGAARTDR